MRRATMVLVAGLAVMAATAVLYVRAQDPQDTRPCLTHDVELADGRSGPAASAVGNVLVANQFSGDASLVNLSNGAVETLDVPGQPHDAVISPDGRWGVVSDFGSRTASGYSGNTLTIIDVAAGRVVRRIETGDYRGIHDLTFRPGAPTRVLATAQTNQRVLEIDVLTGEITSAIPTRGERSHTVAVSPDGRWAFTTNEGSATISRLDLTTKQFTTHFAASDNVEGISTTSDGRELWTGEQGSGIVTVRDATSGALLSTLKGFRHPVRLVRSPDGDRILISDPGCKALIVADPVDRRVTRVIGTTRLGPVLAGDFAGAGHLVLASLLDERAVAVIDIDSGAMLARHRVGRNPDGLGWGPSVR